MGILGIGVDVVHIPRIQAVLRRWGPDKFASRILSQREMREWQFELARSEAHDTIQNARFLAVRWALKEAAYKALYPIVKPTWKELTYQGKSKTGLKPLLQYHPLVDRQPIPTVTLHCSVSHDGDYVLASVLAEERE
ncbi:4'-phosphopantetheinyl transferase [Moniliophthora roreri MCA 2997]|nr:4'-phosphopantetheinyl transferase [Moniliophthora roreri MCA 2997]KAI3612601.1 4'-phosphopantetheinyl transferase [Moniliophthora roreri]